MKAFKGFDKDMKCRGYQFKIGRTEIEDEANCARNGFHCAENPLDCLLYYPDTRNSIYCIVRAEGDIDEDDHDSKISCTELTPLVEITLQHLFYEAVLYMARHPERKIHTLVKEGSGAANENGYVVVRGQRPTATAKGGDIITLIETHPDKPSLILDACVKQIPEGKKKATYALLNHQIVEVII
ncbi:MAG: hypothetical protein PUA49_09365 [Butyrivibrio sp.]|nr:hypothetical protein [Butyrivibrio sp.]